MALPMKQSSEPASYQQASATSVCPKLILIQLHSRQLSTQVGSVISGRLSDRLVIKWRKERGDCWVPEDRLRASVFGIAVLCPMSVLLSGVVTTFVRGYLGLVLNLSCLFFNGAGV